MSTSSARSSVPINLCCVCNPAVISLQVLATSGFYAGSRDAVSDEMSTRSGKCLTLETSPTNARNRSQICAEVSWRDASTLRFLTPVEQSTLPSHRVSSPLRGLVPAAETCRRLIVPEVTTS